MLGSMEMEAGEQREEDLDVEGASLLSSSKKKSTDLVRAAYRAELATKRAVLLALLIIPILLIIVAWHLFDSNAHWGAHSRSAAGTPRPYTRTGGNP